MQINHLIAGESVAATFYVEAVNPATVDREG
jgi:hypothetical protein